MFQLQCREFQWAAIPEARFCHCCLSATLSALDYLRSFKFSKSKQHRCHKPPHRGVVQQAHIENLLSEDDAFIADVEDKYGRRGARQAQELLAEVTGLFAGGEMADEDMREMVDAIQEAYLIAKKNNKKYTPKKYRKDE